MERLLTLWDETQEQMFPIAWALVTVENKDNWLWFLVSLGDDLNLNRGATVTIISDGHKGLKEAVREWLPLAEHRQCARHIYANLKKIWPGLHFKRLCGKGPRYMEQSLSFILIGVAGILNDSDFVKLPCCYNKSSGHPFTHARRY
ncbi:hypothetical protein Tco_0163707 [Tanacetum coccineum]